MSAGNESLCGFRDLPWWARPIYWLSPWFKSLCTDAWSFRRKA